MKTLLTIILSFLLSEFSGGQTEAADHYRREYETGQTLIGILDMVCNDDGTYLYNFGGVVHEEVEGKTIYIIRITNDDTSPYEDILAAYDKVQFEQVEYSLNELEVIGNVFIAAHPEMAEHMTLIVPFEGNIAHIDVTKLDADTLIQFESDMEGLPLSTISGVYPSVA